MLRVVSAALLGTVFAAGPDLTTEYKVDRVLRIEAATELTLETTSSEFVRDGEPMEGRGGGDRATEMSRKIVQLDKVLSVEDGQPAKVRRTFEALEGSSTTSFGEQSRDSSSECPLNGVTLEITAEGAEVVEGDEPDDGKALEGHVMTLSLDALLADGAVEEDAKWDIEPEAILHALGIDIEGALFQRPAPEEGEGGGRGGGGRGRRGGGGGGNATQMFTVAEWEGKAQLISAAEDYEGASCAVVQLEIDGTGSLPEREFGGGRGRGRSPESEPTAPGALENSFQIELEGKLYYSLDAKRPVHLEIEGTLSTESHREFDRGGSTMSMSSTQGGTFRYTVSISEVAQDK